MKIIKSYFNLFNRNLERKMRTKRLLLRFRRVTSNRIYISNGEFKHTNNKVLINIYLYNRQKYNYLNKLRKNYLSKMLKRRKVKMNINNINVRRRKKSINTKIINNMKAIYKKGMLLLKESNNNKYILVNILRKNPSLLAAKHAEHTHKINSLRDISRSTVNFYKKTIRISMRKILMYFFYKQLMYINRSKLNYTYLQKLKLHLEKLYNKNVEFNLVNLKNMFSNSDIMSEVAKLKLTRNRRRLLRLMSKIKDKIKIHRKRRFFFSHAGTELRASQQEKLLPSVVSLNDLRSNKISLKSFVVNNLKYKDITGFRLEARGRLTRRHKAARAISKVRYKGNLSNIDSSHKGLSSVILKGNLKSNLQYTKSYSKTKIGAFGLKG